MAGCAALRSISSLSQSIDGGLLSDRVKDDIVKAVVPLVPDEITFSVRYTKVYADEDTVRVDRKSTRLNSSHRT